MIARYTHPDMGRIWSDQRRYETWLLVETAAAEAMASAGIVPPEAARDIRERGGFDIARIEAIEQTTQHDVIAFTTAVAERVGPSARWLHFGLTSSDVVDTALALQMREACDVDRVRSARKTISVGKLSGAVGTFAHLPPEIEADVCRRLHLEPAAVSSQVIQRVRHADLMAALAITAVFNVKGVIE